MEIDGKEVRLISPIGTVTEVTYRVIGETKRGLILLEDNQKTEISVHRDRIIPVDCLGKAVVVQTGGKYHGVCPRCLRLILVANDKIRCEDHGVFDIIPTSIPIVNNHESQIINSKERTMTPATSQAPILDIAQVQQYCPEIWVKTQIHFNHARVDVKAFTLLLDNPARKLCFNTYDGVLSKKSVDPIAELHIAEFSRNEDITDQKNQRKRVGYLLTGSLDDVRAKLRREGYTLLESEQIKTEEPPVASPEEQLVTEIENHLASEL